MTREEKTKVIDSLTEALANNSNFYLTDTSSMTVETTNKLRRMCFDKKIKVHVVKNSLLKKAMERAADGKYAELIGSLKGTTALMLCESGSDPAKVIKEFRKSGDKPLLKAAFIEESVYVGDNQLESLSAIKSKNELIGDIIGLLQSPAKNVISGLQSGKNKLAGIVKTLSERPE